MLNTDHPTKQTQTMSIYDIEKKYPDKMIEVKFSNDPKSQTIASKIFPISSKNFCFTSVSIFSITPLDQSKFTADLLDYFYDAAILKKKILTDVGAGVGGNVWSLAEKVKHVNAIELDPIQAKCLEHNMKQLEIKNLTIHQANYVEVRYEMSQDILFADPPWGGLEYRNRAEYITEYKSDGKSYPINDIAKTTKAELVILKLPTNHALECFRNIKRYVFAFDLYSEKIRQGKKFTTPLYKIVILSDFPPIHDIPFDTFNRRSRGIARQKKVFAHFNFRDARFDV